MQSELTNLKDFRLCSLQHDAEIAGKDILEVPPEDNASAIVAIVLDSYNMRL